MKEELRSGSTGEDAESEGSEKPDSGGTSAGQRVSGVGPAFRGRGGDMHPADALVIEAVSVPRRLAEFELEQVMRWVATRPFSGNQVKAGDRLAGFLHGGTILTRTTRLPALEQHLLLHTLTDFQWPPNLTAAEYAETLRSSVRNAVEVYTFRFQQEDYVGFLAPHSPSGQLTLGAKPYIWVAYSSRYSTLRTGHQTNGAVRPPGVHSGRYVFDRMAVLQLVRQR